MRLIKIPSINKAKMAHYWLIVTTDPIIGATFVLNLTLAKCHQLCLTCLFCFHLLNGHVLF